METTITDYCNVSHRLSELSCNDPNGFAILPTNFDSAESISEFRTYPEAATVKTLLRNSNLPFDELSDVKSQKNYIHNNDVDWIGPTIFICANLLSENSDLISLALDEISKYLQEQFKTVFDSRKVELDIVIEKEKSSVYKKISYKGDPEGLKKLDKLIKATYHEP